MSNGRNSLRTGVGFGNIGGPEDAEYRPLGHVEEEQAEEMQEFDTLPVLQSKGHRRAWWWIKLIIVGLLMLAVAAISFHWGPLFLDKVIIPLMVWESSKFSRPVLVVVLILSLAIFPIVMFPSGPSMWVTGMMFGYGLGFLIIMAGTTVGQSIPYLIGRWLLHDRIQGWLAKWPKKAALCRLAEQGGWFHQFRTISLLRVSPFPYTLFNYAVTATNIKYGPYIAGSMVGMVPEAFITIYSGRLLSTLADLKNQKRTLTPVEITYNVIGATVAVIVGVTGTFYGRRLLQDLELKEAAEREAAAQMCQPMADVVADSPALKVDWEIDISHNQSKPDGNQSFQEYPPRFCSIASLKQLSQTQSTITGMMVSTPLYVHTMQVANNRLSKEFLRFGWTTPETHKSRIFHWKV